MLRDEFLTNRIGGCCHDKLKFTHDTKRGGGWYQCTKCRLFFRVESFNEEINLSFSTWEGFGKLWEWASEQKWWEDFLVQDKTQNLTWIETKLVNPNHFATELAKFLGWKEE